jgi:hypothetical protein
MDLFQNTALISALAGFGWVLRVYLATALFMIHPVLVRVDWMQRIDLLGDYISEPFQTD